MEFDFLFGLPLPATPCQKMVPTPKENEPISQPFSTLPIDVRNMHAEALREVKMILLFSGARLPVGSPPELDHGKGSQNCQPRKVGKGGHWGTRVYLLACAEMGGDMACLGVRFSTWKLAGGDDNTPIEKSSCPMIVGKRVSQISFGLPCFQSA